MRAQAALADALDATYNAGNVVPIDATKGDEGEPPAGALAAV